MYEKTNEVSIFTLFTIVEIFKHSDLIAWRPGGNCGAAAAAADVVAWNRRRYYRDGNPRLYSSPRTRRVAMTLNGSRRSRGLSLWTGWRPPGRRP